MRPPLFLLVLALLAVQAAPAPAQTTLFAEDFEQGLGNWSASGAWHALADSDPCAAPAVPFPSGATCAFYGGSQGCFHYVTGTGHLALQTPIHLPASAAGVVLRFHSREETECSACMYDNRNVYVSTDGGSQWQLLGEGNLLQAWYAKWIDLSEFRGQDVLLRFTFNTIDHFNNDFHGWCIDDVRVETLPAPVPSIYCTAKPSACDAQIDFAGLPSASSASPFTIAGRAIPRMQPGVLFFGHAAASHPFMGGVLCVQPPTTRTQAMDSGGVPWSLDCMGSFALDFNALIQSGAHPALVPGTPVHAQYWFRDPIQMFGMGLTDAVGFVIAP